MPTTCPECNESKGFEIVPIFPGQLPFTEDKQTITKTFSLKVKCKGCGAEFDVVDNSSVLNFNGLWRKLEILEEKVKHFK